MVPAAALPSRLRLNTGDSLCAGQTAGDMEQSDRRFGHGERSGLHDIVSRLEAYEEELLSPEVALFRLESRDVQRHPAIGNIVNIYQRRETDDRVEFCDE